MDTETMEFTLPPAPRGLCFDRKDFVKTNFSVDNFLAEHQNVTSLETMRDDLGVYLKVLRVAMIELINRDYANFVNLSATLIGFDKTIETIQVPLGNLNEEVLNVKQCLEDAMKELSMWLNQRNSLYKKKQIIKHYSQTLNSLKILENILQSLLEKSSREKTALADRGVMQYNMLKFSITKCDNLLKPEHKSLFNDLGDTLTQLLNDMLFQFWNERDEDNLLKVFIILASFDKVHETELLIRKKAVAPLLQDLINEPSLQRTREGLQGIYAKILSLLDNKLKLLLNVMQHFKLSFLTKQYNFLVNSFWCEVESRLEVNLASIFAPGNPKIFYQRYNESMQFINRLETYCPNEKTVILLHNTSEFRSFQKRWNLPVYFQIRFQEIAGSFEATLQNSPTAESSEDGFLLKETSVCWKSLQDCWSDGVYIGALRHKFWKLTLQLLARYSTWINTLCSEKATGPRVNTNVNKDLISNNINVYIDIKNILQRLPQLLEVIENKSQIADKELLRQSIMPTEKLLNEAQGKVKECIVNELFDNFKGQLKQVSDIPRLYRKTNRSIPTKPCVYIEAVSTALQEFHKEASLRLDNAILIDIYEALFNVMTTLYHKSIEDVLTSVKKTEESLRRLKQIREGTPQQASESSGITDGDKIRLQLNVDVVAYGKMADSLNIHVNNLEKFKNITNMVTDAVKHIDIK